MTLYKLDALSNSTEKISFAVFMVVDFKESFKKYGELSERLAFFEAGHVAQNLQLVSSHLNKKSLPICGLFPEEVEKQIFSVELLNASNLKRVIGKRLSQTRFSLL